MRPISALPLLALAASALAGCNVDSDSANDQVRIEYNGQKIEDAAAATARAAEDGASAIGNVAASTGRAIGDEIGDIDVDVDVTRNRSQGADGSVAGNEAATN